MKTINGHNTGHKHHVVTSNIFNPIGDFYVIKYYIKVIFGEGLISWTTVRVEDGKGFICSYEPNFNMIWYDI